MLNAARVCFMCAAFGFGNDIYFALHRVTDASPCCDRRKKTVPCFQMCLRTKTDFVNLQLGDSPLRYLMESLDQKTLEKNEIKLDAQMETSVCHS